MVLGLRNPAALWLERANPVLLIVGAVASVLFLFGLQLFVVQPLADQFTVPTVWSERFNLAVKFEDALDAEEFRPKTMKLFDAIKLPEIGAIAGVWLILFWWKVKNHLSGEEKLVSGLPLAVTTIIGLLVTFLVVNFIALAEGYLLPSFVIWASVPALLAVAVPFLSQWVVLRTIKDQPQ